RVAPLAYATWGQRERNHAATGRFSVAAMRAYFSVDPPSDLAVQLAGVAAPVQVVIGAEDCVTGVAPLLALSRLFPAGAPALRPLSLGRAAGGVPPGRRPLPRRSRAALTPVTRCATGDTPPASSRSSA